ncbi:MAG TPA: gluconate kinase, partial [Lachnospiraceae bacterium]|nr:gluconate kinase [Lachnospiraceae bacterium]
EYANEFKKNGKGIELYKKTGTPCHPMSPLYKIMWLRDHEEEIFAKTEKFISIKEYVIF